MKSYLSHLLLFSVFALFGIGLSMTYSVEPDFSPGSLDLPALVSEPLDVATADEVAIQVVNPSINSGASIHQTLALHDGSGEISPVNRFIHQVKIPSRQINGNWIDHYGSGQCASCHGNALTSSPIHSAAIHCLV